MTTIVLNDANKVAYLHDIRRRLEHDGHIDRRKSLAERLGDAYHLVLLVQALDAPAPDDEDDDEFREEADPLTQRALRAAPLIRAMHAEERTNHYRTLRIPTSLVEDLEARRNAEGLAGASWGRSA